MTASRRNTGPDPREANLPKWAQGLLEQCRMEISETRTELDQIRGADPRRPLAVRSPYRDPVPVAWDRYDTIRFFPLADDGQRHAIDVYAHGEDQNVLVVRASYGALSIRPDSSNRIYLKVD